MQPASRHDIALLFVRALAVFTLYEPFLTVCSIIASAVTRFLFGPPMNPAQTEFALAAFWYLLAHRLIAAFFLWRFAPPIARLVSAPVPVPAGPFAKASLGNVVAGNAHH